MLARVLESFGTLFTHPTFWVTAVAWLSADVVKVALLYFQDGVVDWKRFFGTGGMPSSHTAFVSGFSTCVGLSEGFNSPIFGLSLAFSILTAVDACGLRRSAGLQAEVLNKMVAELQRGKKNKLPHLRETLGHSVIEVVVGACIGAGVVFLLYPSHP
jgi:acid phosphatase family membrane protein YuiD